MQLHAFAPAANLTGARATESPVRVQFLQVDKSVFVKVIIFPHHFRMKERLLLPSVDVEDPCDRVEDAEVDFVSYTKETSKSPQTVFSLLRFLIFSSANNVVLLVVILFICIGRQLVIAYVLAPTVSSFIKYIFCLSSIV